MGNLVAQPAHKALIVDGSGAVLTRWLIVGDQTSQAVASVVADAVVDAAVVVDVVVAAAFVLENFGSLNEQLMRLAVPQSPNGVAVAKPDWLDILKMIAVNDLPCDLSVSKILL